MARRPDPNRMYRHFVCTMNVHPTREHPNGGSWPFPDPIEGIESSVALDNMVNQALFALDQVFGRNLRYRIAQLEKGSKSDEDPATDEDAEAAKEASHKTGFHLQCYVETAQSIRLRTVWRALPFAYVRPRRGLRDTAREYCMPEKGSPFVGAYDPTHIAGPWEVGEWRPSKADEEGDSPLDAATRMVCKMPTVPIFEVAHTFPRVFVRHGRGLMHLHRMLHPGCECCTACWRDANTLNG